MLCRLWVAFSARLSALGRIEHVHLGRRLGVGRELEHDLDTVDHVRLDRLLMICVGGISVTVPREMTLPRPASTWPRGPFGQQGAELEHGAADHRRAGQDVLLVASSMKRRAR